jgi:ATP-dependent DNA helicase 2 subunit 2
MYISDLDAIVVGMDMLIKKAGPGNKGNKHIFLFTDGESFVKDSAEDESKEEQVDKLAVQLTEHGMKLDAVVIKSKHGSFKSIARIENETLLGRFAKRPQVEVALVDYPTSLLGAIKPRNVTPVTLFRGDLELTPNMKVKVMHFLFCVKSLFKA